MNRPRAWFIAALVVVSALAAAMTANAAPEHERLTAMSGIWDVEMTFWFRPDYPLAGDLWHQRTVIQPASAGAMTATSYLSFGNVPEWKGVEIKYTRRAK